MAVVAKRDQLIAKLQEELQYIQETAGEEAKEFDRRVRFQDEEVARTYQQVSVMVCLYQGKGEL